MATLRTRAAVAALRASEAKQSAHAGDVTHDLNDLLTAINGHAELLIAALDPGSASIQDAQEIQRAVLGAALLAAPLRTSKAGHAGRRPRLPRYTRRRRQPNRTRRQSRR